MTFPAPLVKSLLMAASIGLVVPMLAQAPAAARSEAAGEAAGEEPKVIGVERAWPGGLMGLAIEGNAFVLRFYDVDKKPVPVPAARATVRWNPVNRTGDERAVMNPDSGLTLLRSPSIVRPPHVFVAYVTLLDEEGNALSTLQFDLRELAERK